MWNKFIHEIMRYRVHNSEKLIAYGFSKEGNKFCYKKDIVDGLFYIKVEIDGNELKADVFEKETGEPYTLYLVESASGSFVGKIRAEYEKLVYEIVNQCFTLEVFTSNQSKGVIEYIKSTYGDEPEYLWEKLVDCAVWRRKDNKKWYSLITNIPLKRLGLEDDRIVTIMNLHLPETQVEELIDNVSYFKAYHMNKKHWITIVLDDKVSMESLIKLIDSSYSLAKK
ncbi:MAG: MmcQ/YjbR family DNA-binding protein [Anaeroplasmataceae bacterium]|nr:MmcQ/YjbR family DNA-binding protein [Anaeroplasmataceae bacterium]